MGSDLSLRCFRVLCEVTERAMLGWQGVMMTAFGPERRLRDVRYSAAVGGQADIHAPICDRQRTEEQPGNRVNVELVTASEPSDSRHSGNLFERLHYPVAGCLRFFTLIRSLDRQPRGRFAEEQ